MESDASGSDGLDLSLVANSANKLQSSESPKRVARLDVYMFFSFDLVGSTALKSRDFSRLNYSWIDVIKYFYARCSQLLQDLGVRDANVWKYVGDEVLFFKKIRKQSEVEDTVSAIYRCLDVFMLELSDIKYPEVASYISVKAIAWIAPIQSYFEPNGNKFYPPDEASLSYDQMIDQPYVDFLGPNTDAGFRLGVFARKKQLVVSPGLAHYLWTAGVGANDLRIVGFAPLKGVAAGALYPGIWYHENWPRIHQSFTYEERHGDELIKIVCAGEIEPLSCLDEVKARFARYGYFFENQTLNDIMKTS